MSDPEGTEARPRPAIGIGAAWDRAAWSFWDQDAALVAGTYLDCVRRAGGLPIMLAPEPLSASDVEALIARIDGLLLIGGADLDPASYGEVATARTEATYPLRDEFELALVRGAFAADLPVLGICRGLQIMNAATGGTLHQHLADAGFAEHRALPGSLGEPTMHALAVEPGSRPAAPVPGTVNSHHHQGIDRVGEGGQVVARSVPDGLVEAVQWPRLRYALGVQWHPEAMQMDATIAALVAATAEACGDACRPVGDKREGAPGEAGGEVASPRMRVGLFITCLGDTLFPETGRATVEVLEQLGHTVVFPAGQTCCGQMHANSGYGEEAMPLVRGFVRRFGGDGLDAIVAPSGSCVAMVRHHYPRLAAEAGDPALEEAVGALAPRVFELCEFLAGELGVTDVGACYPHRVVYHPSCHGLRMLGLGEAPLRLLRAVDGIELRELEEAESCCGFGGTFAVKNADVSAAMLADKVQHVLGSGAEVCTATDSSCLMHIGGALWRGRTGVRAVHVAEILAATESG